MKYEEGDIVKVFHFIGPRRKRYYMYKVIVRKGDQLLAMDISELAMKGFDEAHTCLIRFLPESKTEIISRGK